MEKPAGLDGDSLWPVLLGRAAPKERKPMVWVFPEYAGQVAVRSGNFKAVRQNLATRSPGAWEIYDLANDRAEASNLAARRPDLVQQAEEILRREVAKNPVFPVSIPGVIDDDSRPPGKKSAKKK